MWETAEPSSLSLRPSQCSPSALEGWLGKGLRWLHPSWALEFPPPRCKCLHAPWVTASAAFPALPASSALCAELGKTPALCSERSLARPRPCSHRSSPGSAWWPLDEVLVQKKCKRKKCEVFFFSLIWIANAKIFLTSWAVGPCDVSTTWSAATKHSDKTEGSETLWHFKYLPSNSKNQACRFVKL